MKTKNPLYVIKGKDVLEAKGIFDLVIKKLNLEPLLQVLQNILKMLLDQVKTWESFIAVKTYMDELMANYFMLIKKFGLA